MRDKSRSAEKKGIGDSDFFPTRCLPEKSRCPLPIFTSTNIFAKDRSILAAYLFGSQAVGRANKYSDIDVGVLFDGRLPSSRYTGRQLAIMDGITAAMGIEADLVVLNRAPSFLKYHIIKDGIRIYEKPGRTSRTFEARAILEYFDYLPIKTMIETAMIKRIKEVHQ